MAERAATLRANLAAVRDRMAAACARAGRPVDAVRLVAVTKYVDAETARLVVEAGCPDLGESRPQELWRKAAALAGTEVRWHLIGSLQRNKAARTAGLATLIHSVDSLALLEAIGAGAKTPRDVLLEINVSSEAAKHGLAPADVPARLNAIGALPATSGVRVRGLMAMAGRAGDLEAARREFAALREWREAWRPLCGPNVSLDELSMGMSGDFEIAIEEGSTLVRVGSALFEGCDALP
jgi:pyridoxal phosphate enzyme (YggS family)